ncbi:PREDICTED: uncharacterized protein LOC109310431 [Crocodylus porosus]|uniref:uncharacterized protein LOC109310431 n=1 Tax=Crocodylus porosus TaxID=8502 RepID=UPI00093D7A2E|nr:PREDICTED: uncharacterized protein LOC109310431 [Crocodylus porosus]
MLFPQQGAASRVLYTLIIFILDLLLNLLEWLEPEDKDTSSRTDAREKQVKPQPDQHAAVSGGKYGIYLWSEHSGSHPISKCHDNTGPKQMPAESASLTNIQLGCSPMSKMMYRPGRQLPKLSRMSHQLPRKQALQSHHQVKPAQTDVLKEKVASVLSPVKLFSAPYQVPVDPFSMGPSLGQRTHPPIPQNDQLFSSFVDDFEKLPRKQALQNHHQVKPAQTDVLKEKVTSVSSPVKPFSAPSQQFPPLPPRRLYVKPSSLHPIYVSLL